MDWSKNHGFTQLITFVLKNANTGLFVLIYSYLTRLTCYLGIYNYKDQYYQKYVYNLVKYAHEQCREFSGRTSFIQNIYVSRAGEGDPDRRTDLWKNPTIWKVFALAVNVHFV